MDIRRTLVTQWIIEGSTMRVPWGVEGPGNQRDHVQQIVKKKVLLKYRLLDMLPIQLYSVLP